jgi:hypothetical protein
MRDTFSRNFCSHALSCNDGHRYCGWHHIARGERQAMLPRLALTSSAPRSSSPMVRVRSSCTSHNQGTKHRHIDTSARAAQHRRRRSYRPSDCDSLPDHAPASTTTYRNQTPVVSKHRGLPRGTASSRHTGATVMRRVRGMGRGP